MMRSITQKDFSGLFSINLAGILATEFVCLEVTRNIKECQNFIIKWAPKTPTHDSRSSEKPSWQFVAVLF